MRPSGISWERWPGRGLDMSILLFNGFLLLGFVVATLPDVMVQGMPGPTQVVQRDLRAKRCRYVKEYSLLEARCPNMELAEIPKNLDPDIQVLDATVNRLRELTNESLTPYKNLNYIYLADNFIQNIEEAAFARQYYLEVLDLSTNGCDNLPKSLFQLPYLRTLYFARNKFTDSVLSVSVSSPLKALYLSKNKLTKIPDMGLLPTLTYLNVSENAITSISTEDLAPFCSLKVLDLSRNPIRFTGKDCKCQALNAWLKIQQIEVKPKSDLLNCNNWPSENAKQCANVQISNMTYEIHNNCSEIIQRQVETEKARSVWIMVVSCVSVFIVCVFVTLFCLHKRNRRRRRKQKEQQQQLTANNANTELLNSNLAPGNT